MQQSILVVLILKCLKTDKYSNIEFDLITTFEFDLNIGISLGRPVYVLLHVGYIALRSNLAAMLRCWQHSGRFNQPE